MANQNHPQSLISRAKKGDRSAFDELVETHRHRLDTRVRARIGDKLRQRIDEDDILQETFLRAFQTIERFQWSGEDSFFHWLAAISEHLILNSAQKKRVEFLKVERDFPGDGTSPSKALQRDERFDRLRAAVASLPPEPREVVLLARIEGLPSKDIARRIGRSPGAVRQLLFRGLRQLQESFGDTGSLHLPHRSLSDEDTGNG